MSKSIKFILQEMPEKDIDWVQLIRVGKFDHACYGKFDITEEVLKSFKLNFDRNARGVDIAVDYFHESFSEAAGWIKEIELKENDSQLWIRVEWTDRAKEKILGKEIRYISADFDLEYVDSETKKEYGATLYGAGLTNRPHVKDMKPVFSEIIEQTKNKKDTAMTIDFKDILESVANLSEDEKLQLGEKLGFSVKTSDDTETTKKLADAEDAKKLAESKIKTQEDNVLKLSGELKSLKDDLAEKGKEIQFNEMFTNGKVVEAQREAFMKGDMAKFATNAVSINLDEVGSNSASSSLASENATTKFEEIVKVKVDDGGMTYKEAYKAARKENPKLVSAIEA